MPLNVSPVCGLARLSLCGCGGGRGRERSMLGNAAVPAITDKKSRRSIVPGFKDVSTPSARKRPVPSRARVTERHRRKQYITEYPEMKAGKPKTAKICLRPGAQNLL